MPAFLLSARKLFFALFLFPAIFLRSAHAQVLIDDFLVNSSPANQKGLGRPAIAAHSNGSFAVAWQDFNDYNNPVAEQPRIAVQLFSGTAAPVGPTNLFRGESRSLSIWTSDFLEPNPDIAFQPDGTLLIAVEHEGQLSIAGDAVSSSEVGLAGVSPAGEIIDASGPSTNGNILWLISTTTKFQQRPRLAMAPSGDFFMALDGITYDTNFNTVLIQQFDPNGAFAGDFFIPHRDDPGPNANHQYSDMATNGSTHLVVWQDGRRDNNWDISMQVYNNNGAVGSNRQVNSGDPAGTINIWPSVVMNAAGNSVVVWADTRNNPAGEIFGQRFDASGQAVGGNFQISSGHGEIMDRPEVAILDDGRFMVVWTDSSYARAGIEAYRARGRIFAPDATPMSDVFILPNEDVASGLANVASDGAGYYLTWLDDRRDETYLNLHAKKLGPLATSVANTSIGGPAGFSLQQNYPNPFNPETTIRFTLPQRAFVTVQVFDLAGREVATLLQETKPAGSHALIFDASHLPSGVYLYRIQAGNFQAAKKFLLLK